MINFRIYADEDAKGLRVVVVGIKDKENSRIEFYVYKDDRFKQNCEDGINNAKQKITEVMTQLELDRFKAYKATLIFDLTKQCEELGYHYTMTAVNSPVTFKQYSWHTHAGQAQEQVDNLIEEAKNIMTKIILKQIDHGQIK